MAVPISQVWTVATYVLKQKLKGRKRYPLVLMLEPLFRCNLACAGCGKIQYPAHILKQELTPEECFRAVEECGAPMVSIPGGEPLLHPQIAEIVDGPGGAQEVHLHVHQCAAAEGEAAPVQASKYLTFSVHLDGQREHHDFSVCREGGYDIAVEGIREAVARGFRVTTNTTLFDGADPNSVRALFDEVMAVGVEGMMVSPGLHLRQGSGPEALPGPRALAKAVPRDSVEPEEELEVQHVAAVSGIPDGQARLRVHAVGHRRHTTSSAGRSLAICCRTAMPTPSRN